ncbi:MAG: REDY-like protein HapK [Gammaproteobacteria bacterium]
MAKIIVLFNLKAGVSVADYEAFARDIDLPIVNKLPSVDRFEILKSEGLLGGGASPYAYVEVLEVNSLDQLGKDISTETMQKVAATFQSMTENPLFIVTRNL